MKAEYIDDLAKIAATIRRKYPGPEGLHKRNAITEAEDHLGAVLELLSDPIYRDIREDLKSIVEAFNRSK